MEQSISKRSVAILESVLTLILTPVFRFKLLSALLVVGGIWLMYFVNFGYWALVGIPGALMLYLLIKSELRT
jgi:hypothetical protein